MKILSKSLFRLGLTCFLLVMALVSFAQNVTISGNVSASDGPLPGASITIRGTKTGTATDINGKYTLKAASGNVLVIQSIGFVTQQITVGSNPVINVKLVTANSVLNEVVVVGYGTQKRSNITGAVASLKAGIIDERPVNRVDQALVGQLAGVTVKQTTGVPGKAFSIQVRGSGSISGGNEPLYVLDGFPLQTASTNTAGSFSNGNPLDNINPNDIESIEVLKDAASAAIYGSRAANGVVLITTKKGKTGVPQISYNGYVGYNEASRKLKMLDGQGWINRATELINAAWVASGTGRTASQTNEQRRVILGLAQGNVNTALMTDDRWALPGHPGLTFINWEDQAFRKGLMENHQLTASGGTDNVKYYISGNYNNQDGMVIGLGYKSYSARANVDINATKKLKIGINLAPTYSITQDPGVEGKDNILHQLLSYAPVQEDSVGVNANVGKNAQYRWSATTNSPISKLLLNVGETKRYRTLGSIYGDYEIIKHLNFRTTLNLDNTDNSYSSYVPFTNFGSLSTRLAQGTINTSGTYTTYRKQTFTNENTLTYSPELGASHNLNILLGQSYNTDRLDISSIASNGGFANNSIQTLNYANAITGSTSTTKDVLLSYFSRVQYSYKDKYLLSGSIRTDGSSRFGANTKYGYFPSASVGWRIIEEDFMKKIPAISDLKIRASYGQAGNYNIGDYSAISVLGISNYTFGSATTAATGQASTRITNPDLTWEKSNTKDIGLDFGLFKNRITGSIDYYNKLTTDLLFNVPTLAVTGFNSYLSNAGSVRNTGWEVELTSQNTTGGFKWSTSVNLSHNANKVVSLPNGQNQLLIPSSFDVAHSILQVGQPLYSIYVIKQVGILSQADITNKAALYGSETVGDPKYMDANGDGVIDANDRVIVGHPNPNYTYGITNTFRYKNFDLTVLVQGQQGGSIYSLLGRALTRTGQGFTDNVPAFYENRWYSEANPGDGRVGKAYSTFGRIVNTDWLYSSDYIRVRNITLGYNLGSISAIKRYVKNIRIYTTAENFFGHDKYYGGLNPEATNTDLSGNGSYPEAGDYGGLPLAKSLVFGLNVTF
ncbi:MAG: SusC/RagA family TonB-linked outer membrane protein [Janthinobacterium lividum]